jgi:hypothetical protein
MPEDAPVISTVSILLLFMHTTSVPAGRPRGAGASQVPAR